MRLLRAGGCLFLLVACKPAAEAEDTDAIAPPDPVVDTEPPPPPTSDFREDTWVVDDLSILEDTDLDDDGVIDNKLPQVLAAVDTLMRTEDMSVARINENIAGNIAQLVTIVFLDARSPDGESLAIDVLAGVADPDGVVSIDPGSYDEDGEPRSQLVGAFEGPLDFVANGDVLLRVTMMTGLDPSPVQLHSVVLDASMTESQLVVTGLMKGVIPVERFIDEAIAPVIPEEGFEIFPGTQSSREEVLAILHDLAPGLADVTLPSGEVGISAAFEIVAGHWDFSNP